MSRNGTLRFSEAEFAERKARRDAFNSGSRGRIVVPEREVQAAILELVKHHPSVAWAKRMSTASGFLLYADKFKELVAAGHLKTTDARFIRFGFPGMADVTGQLRDGRRLEIEAKSDSGKPTDDQVAFLDAVAGAGGVAFVARSIDDVVKGLG